MQELLTLLQYCKECRRLGNEANSCLSSCRYLQHNGTLLLQAKSYVHVLRRADDNDRGYVSISYSRYATRLHVEDKKAHYCRIALLCAFAFLNILTPIALAKSLSWYYPRVRAVACRSTLHGMLVLGCGTHRFPIQYLIRWNVSTRALA